MNSARAGLTARPEPAKAATTRVRNVGCIALAAILSVGHARGADWPNWRGPSWNGSSPETGLPSEWGPSRNVVWKVQLPGIGASTPVVASRRVFITAFDREANANHALVLDAATGRPIADIPAGPGFSGKTGNTSASPSAVTDGRRAVFMFGTGELFATDMDGRVLWRRNIQKDHGRFHIMWKYGASPLLYKDRLYIAVIHQHTAVHPAPGEPRPASYLLCVDPATGRDIWKSMRDTDAPREAMEAYTTPYPFIRDGNPLIVLAGGDHVTGHDPADGHEVWRSPSLNPRRNPAYRLVPTPVSVGDLLFVCIPRGHGLIALRPAGQGRLCPESIVWRTSRNAPDVCTPLVYRDRLFVLDGRRKTLTCFAPATGAIIWRGKLPAKTAFQASPTGADGRIYCIDMSGTVFVVDAGPEFRIISRIDMGGKGCRASIAAANRRLFIRTDRVLTCVVLPDARRGRNAAAP